MNRQIELIGKHLANLKHCSRCPDMQSPVVVGRPVASPVMLIGQAPGYKEIDLHKPFAWTAGKTLFKWLLKAGMNEEQFRSRVYMAAVCRCFPGKNPKGGDRVPNKKEIMNCSSWVEREFQLLKPSLLLPVGKLAITQLLPIKKLDESVGKKHTLNLNGFKTDIISLPHPSGASVWHRVEPGKSLLEKALLLIKEHPAWKQLIDQN